MNKMSNFHEILMLLYESLQVTTGLQDASQGFHDSVCMYDVNFTLTATIITTDSSILVVSTVMISCVCTTSKI